MKMKKMILAVCVCSLMLAGPALAAWTVTDLGLESDHKINEGSSHFSSIGDVGASDTAGGGWGTAQSYDASAGTWATSAMISGGASWEVATCVNSSLLVGSHTWTAPGGGYDPAYGIIPAVFTVIATEPAGISGAGASMSTGALNDAGTLLIYELGIAHLLNTNTATWGNSVSAWYDDQATPVLHSGGLVAKAINENSWNVGRIRGDVMGIYYGVVWNGLTGASEKTYARTTTKFTDINESNDIIAHQTTGGTEKGPGELGTYDGGATFTWTWTAIPELAGTTVNSTSAEGLDDAGNVVGYSDVAGASVGWIWDSVNGVRSLDSLTTGSGWTITHAYDLANDGSSILVKGTLAGTAKWGIVVVPEPITLAVLSLGGLLALLRRRRA